ncbi:type II toxin-antitoxin system prevent-host-death family antitoxin [Ruoffia tabacinasalis]|uniref:Prevent-host-death protein n=1 Tax=Ruoffia tabacinasalis TaxID=87458 RepID=A0ABS0LNF9_9LACT|nr:type II toxin-antitoxin system prevent-host-death family antitoxin [Ruoffia tabacinasalis]MBG9978986.1 prevent-host-death protein [Ruoffia tabacinasalis]
MNIKPISDHRNYSQLLEEVSVGNPVYLSKDNCPKYLILAIEDFEEIERTKATLLLLLGLQRGEQSGDIDGWLAHEKMRKEFGS